MTGHHFCWGITDKLDVPGRALKLVDGLALLDSQGQISARPGIFVHDNMIPTKAAWHSKLI